MHCMMNQRQTTELREPHNQLTRSSPLSAFTASQRRSEIFLYRLEVILWFSLHCWQGLRPLFNEKLNLIFILLHKEPHKLWATNFHAPVFHLTPSFTFKPEINTCTEHRHLTSLAIQQGASKTPSILIIESSNLSTQMQLFKQQNKSLSP